jgi:ligand-binding SRPBCC domain-containing protein
MKLVFKTTVASPFEKVVRNFDVQLLQFLSPTFPIVKIEQYGGNQINDEIDIKLNFILFSWTWVSRITEFFEDEKKWFFVDEGIVLPPFLNFWRHKHEIETIDNQSCIIDSIEFEAAKNWPDWLVKFLVWFQFSQRSDLYIKYFEKLS